MLCYFSYVTLCYVTLCYVTLCYVTLCYVTLCYVTLCYVTLCYAMKELCSIIPLGCLIFTAAIGVQIPVVAVKFHVYDYTIERHPWQVSPKPCEGNWVVRLVPDETQD